MFFDINFGAFVHYNVKLRYILKTILCYEYQSYCNQFTEFRSNLKKYLAKFNKVLIQQGRTETFALVRETSQAPDAELQRAITADELLVSIEEDIRKIFRKSSLGTND